VEKRELVIAALISVFLLPMVTGTLSIYIVSGNFVLVEPERVPEGIRINVDGTVEGTEKIQRSGNIYTLTGNIYRTIAVLRDGIVLDGAGFTLQGNGTGSGVFLQERNKVTIRNLKINNFEYGIKFTWLNYGSQTARRDNEVIGNTILNNTYGIAFNDYSEGNVITDNYIADNSYGIHFSHSNNVLRNNRFVNNEYSISDYSPNVNDIDKSNMVNGKPVYYWYDQHDKAVPSDAGWVVLKNCTGITVENLNLEGNGYGVLLHNTNYTKIRGNTVTNNVEGIVLRTSSNNIISGNNITKNNGDGIQLSYESNNNSIISNRIWANTNCGIRLDVVKNSSIIGNNITSNRGTGIELRETDGNVISKNYIERNALGIQIGWSWQDVPIGNTITENTVIQNNGWGIKLDPTQTKNVIHHNNFINNNVTEGLQVSIPGQWAYRDGWGQWLPGNPNTWDDGKEGNYWSDYETRYPEAKELGNTGVWNTPFYINENNIDGYPLVNPWEIQSSGKENEKASSVEPFPTTLAVVSSVTLTVFSFGFLINLARRKRR
jgi:parallel beta-helix repeat protein